ncbi:MAG: hypothetical protein KGH61_01510 [Candidatus Micrarchaeota archaeon]|nr:hypothetical protein [Candidatus Micrarchaeota archaeon]MDE1825904.1 hypothetical protein [Candidatus Micrarchaeota archaeon]MDE1847608.1 hypothetical protein [Candidatus Micrarchaeota archaeon]MDE1863811.1 hypothetical protein [Candidatus Micrarchaeota archaeon]
MDYRAYARRRRMEIKWARIKLHRLFSLLEYGDFERVQALLSEVEAILERYEFM